MKTYKVKAEVEITVQAVSEEDAKEILAQRIEKAVEMCDIPDTFEFTVIEKDAV